MAPPSLDDNWAFEARFTVEQPVRGAWKILTSPFSTGLAGAMYATLAPTASMQP
jgi:hypothetical protein